MPPGLVAALRDAGAAGGNLEDADHADGGGLRDPGRNAEWMRAVRRAAAADGYGLVMMARPSPAAPR